MKNFITILLIFLATLPGFSQDIFIKTTTVANGVEKIEQKKLTDIDSTFKAQLGVTEYGTMGFSDSSIVISMTQNVYAQITNASKNLYTPGVSVGGISFVGDSIKITANGDYEINWDLSFSGSNADEYHISIFVNDVEEFAKGEAIRDMSTSNIGVSTSHTILSLILNDMICIRIKNVNNNNNATVVAGNLTAHKL